MTLSKKEAAVYGSGPSHSMSSASSFHTVSRNSISYRDRLVMSSRTMKDSFSVSMFLAASSCLLDAVVIFVFRGDFGLDRRFVGAFGNIDGTASFFKYSEGRGFCPAVVSVVTCCCLACL